MIIRKRILYCWSLFKKFLIKLTRKSLKYQRKDDCSFLSFSPSPCIIPVAAQARGDDSYGAKRMMSYCIFIESISGFFVSELRPDSVLGEITTRTVEKLRNIDG